MKTLEEAGVPCSYPIPCPQCASVAVVPVAALTVAHRPRSLRIDFKCQECGFGWREQFEEQFNIAACA